jgi:hypothetical protein
LELAESASPENPVADLPAASALLTLPLPVVKSMAVEPVTLESIEHSHPSEMSDDELWASMHVAAAHDEPVGSPVAAEPAASGLTKRVRGAQLPDLGSATLDAPPARAADDVRATLTSLQRGLDLGRQHGTED